MASELESGREAGIHVMAPGSRRRGARPIAFCLIAGALLLGISASPGASAQDESRQTASLRFVETKPATPSALTFEVDYVNPNDPDAKPPAVRRVIQTLAAGARFDTSVPKLCTASDAELILLGPSACPLGSVVGGGTIRIDTGLPEPARFLDANVTFLNNTDELIFVSAEALTGVRVVTRSIAEEGRIVNTAPLLPGTPPDGGAIDVVLVRLDAISRVIEGSERGYITTPTTCPRGRAWINTSSFTYADGVTQTAETRSPCTGRTRVRRASS